MGFFTTSLGPGSTVRVKGKEKIGGGKKKTNKQIGGCFTLFFVSP